MWNTELMDKLNKISCGSAGSDTERYYLNRMLCFYAQDARGNYYDVGYDKVKAYYNGSERNPFVWIECYLFPRKSETVYSMEE